MANNRKIYVSKQTYTNTTPTPQEHGGVSEGETFDSLTMQQMFDKILYPYIAPDVSLSVSPSSYLREYGDTVSSVDLTADYSTNSSENVDSLEMFKDGISIYSLTGLDSSSGTETYTDSNGVSDDTTYRVDIDDGVQVVSDYNSYSFVYPYYHGVGAPGLTSSEVQNLTKVIETKSDKSYEESPTEEVYYFAYPKSYGYLSKILDPNNFDITDDFTTSEESFSMLDGTTQTYIVYEFNNVTTQTNFEITYKY